MTNSEIETESESNSFSKDVTTAVIGFCMGLCDAVPGVSGGTVALVVGIYDRLFASISSFDRKLIKLLGSGRIAEAFKYCNGRFLISLLMGVAVGYVVMSKGIKILMASESLRPLTLASFAGMIIGSLWIVFGMINIKTLPKLVTNLLAAISGCAISVTIAMQSNASTEEIGLVYLFFCAVIAICAMILPGISGAMLLLIFGVYYFVLDIPGELLEFKDVGKNLLRLTVFVSGCALGLLTFSRVIKWLLNTHRMPTLSAMMGLMAGSLVILWPFQNRIEPANPEHKPTYEAFMPEQFGGTVIGAIVCVILFASVVILVDRTARRRNLDCK